MAALPALLAALLWPAPAPPPPLTTCREVRFLTHEEAVAGRPVRLAGVVTHVNPDAAGPPGARVGDFFLHDGTAGVYVTPSEWARPARFGERVEVEGVTGGGHHAPVVRPSRVRAAGPGALPPPIPFDLNWEAARALDAQWVEVWAVVGAAQETDRHTRLEVFTARGRATLLVVGRAAGGGGPAVVVARGVCLPGYRDGRVTGPPLIYVTDPPTVTPAPGAAPPTPIGQLRGLAVSRRVTVAGVVTARPAPDRLYVEDGTSGAAVVAADPPPAAVGPGSRVAVTGGYEVRGKRVVLTGAAVVAAGPPAVLRPSARPAAEVAAGVGTDTLLRVEGRVEGVRAAGGWTVLALADGGTRFEAFAPGPPAASGLDRTAVGDRVAVTGVAGDFHPDGRPAGAFGLTLNGPGGVALVEPAPPSPPPPYWTPGRVAALAAGGGLAVALAAGWVVALRVRVRAAAAEVARQYEEKARLQGQLREAQKLEAVGRLAGGIAHDFNNLLTVINGCAQMLGDNLSGPAAGLAADIRDAGERAAALTTQLLTFARRRPVAPRPTDLNAAVRDAARLLARVAGDRAEVRLELDPAVPPAWADAGLVGQVLVNLTANARDAMPGGGVVTVRTGPGPGGGVRLSVADTGEGMPPEVLARVFEPFFTTKEVGKGTGLGLAVVWGIAEALGGRVAAASAPGRGTRVDLDLPPAAAVRAG